MKSVEEAARDVETAYDAAQEARNRHDVLRILEYEAYKAYQKAESELSRLTGILRQVSHDSSTAI